MWKSIVPVPDHCLFIYFETDKNSHLNNVYDVYDVSNKNDISFNINKLILIYMICFFLWSLLRFKLDRAKQIWYLSPMRAAKVQASLRIRAVSPEPSLLAHRSSESRGTFRQKARSLAPLNGWACALKMCHDGMLEDTNSLDGAQLETPK